MLITSIILNVLLILLFCFNKNKKVQPSNEWSPLLDNEGIVCYKRVKTPSTEYLFEIEHFFETRKEDITVYEGDQIIMHSWANHE